MELKIREMRKDDWDAVAAIYQEGINIEIATFQTEVPSYESWDQGHIKSCRLVVTAKDQVIGWAALSPCSTRCVFAGVAEVSIYIKDGYRRKNVGETLLAALIAETEKEGYWSLLSVIIENNTASIALHKKAGFRMIGYREKIAKDINGVWQNTVMMEKRSLVVGI